MFSRTTAAASIVLLLCVRAGRAVNLHGEEIGALNAFFAAINASSEAATKVVALDIGSNDGKWSSHVLNHLTQQGRRCRLVMFEAQTTLLHQLHSIAKHHAPQHSVEVVGSAVWTSDTKLTFHLSKNSEVSRPMLHAMMHQFMRAPRHMATRALQRAPHDALAIQRTSTLGAM